MGTYGTYHVDFELAKLHQRHLRDERAAARLAPKANNPLEQVGAEMAAPRRNVTQQLWALVQRCRPQRTSIATAE